MVDQRIEKLINECKRLEEDSTYTAEAHHLHASYWANKIFWLKFIPALITVITAGILTIYSWNWLAWLTVISGALSIFNILNNQEKKADEHLTAAKYFTIIKQEARSLHESFQDFMQPDSFYHLVNRLREKYNMLVLFSPPTDNVRLWNKARKNIKDGVHQPDYKK